MGIDLTFGASKMTEQYHIGAGFYGRPDGRERSANSRIVGNTAIIAARDIEIHADKGGFPFQLGLFQSAETHQSTL